MLKKLFLIISLLVTILFSQTLYAQDDSLEEELEEGPEIIPVGVATATEGTIHQLLQFIKVYHKWVKKSSKNRFIQNSSGCHWNLLFCYFMVHEH